MNTEKMIRESIVRNWKAAVKGLLLVYKNQTLDEMANSDTFHKNGMGFNSSDAFYLSKLAKDCLRWIENNGEQGTGYKFPLSVKQLKIVQDRLPKYWRQLAQYVGDNKTSDDLSVFIKTL